jgi:hypothetical protein
MEVAGEAFQLEMRGSKGRKGMGRGVSRKACAEEGFAIGTEQTEEACVRGIPVGEKGTVANGEVSHGGVEG